MNPFLRMRAALLAEGHGVACPVAAGIAETCDCKTFASFARSLGPSFGTGYTVVKNLTIHLHRHRMIHSCMTCVLFNADYEHCTLWNAHPPARVIAFGCPSWLDDSAEIMADVNARVTASGGRLSQGEAMRLVLSQRYPERLDGEPF